MDEVKSFPTMIIPNGTDISVNENGQLSIRTPGNLVIQNSGVYSVIQSASGSVRIDPEVKVEAVSVEAADSCFVAGELTAWRVRARKIALEKGAQANIMLQESEALELDRNARLVGNFASEKELYLMLGRFSRQLRDLPETLGGGSERLPLAQRVAPPPGHGRSSEDEDPFGVPEGVDAGPALEPHHRQEVLTLVRVVLERELGRPGLGATGRQAVEKLLELVREDDLGALDDGYRFLLSQVERPSDDLDRARGMLARLLENR